MAKKRKEQGSGSPPVSAERRKITPVDIQQKEFRLAVRGYNERDVDQFLDELTEEFARIHAENKRLREEFELKGTVRLDAAGAADAEAVLRRAREEASRILSKAEAHAEMLRASAAHAGGAAAGTPSAPPGFFGQEREFLQSLAALIQGHAQTVKEEIRRSREAAEAASQPEPVVEDPVDAGAEPAAAAPDQPAVPEAEAWSGPGTQVSSPSLAPSDEPAPAEDVGQSVAGADIEDAGASAGQTGRSGGESEATPWWADAAAEGGRDAAVTGGSDAGPGRSSEASAVGGMGTSWAGDAPVGIASAPPETEGGTEARIVDLTQHPVTTPDGSTGKHEAGPATSTVGRVEDEPSLPGRHRVEIAPAAPGPEAEDRSLKELFWGED
jgi:DivIVA domain-containing protein